MKIAFYVILLSSIFVTSCKIGGIKGNGDWVKDTRPVDEFSKVDVSGNFSVEITANKEQNLTIDCESNLSKYIKTKVRSNTLYIYSKENLRPSDDIIINISVKDIDYVECSGLNNIKVNNIYSDKFGVDLSGAGTIELEGKTNSLKVDVSGAAELVAKELITADIRLDVSGAANAEVYASNSINGDISGAGSVDLYGGAKDVNLDISGAASLNRK